MRRLPLLATSVAMLSVAIVAPAQAVWVNPEPALNTPAPLVQFATETGILNWFPADDPWRPSGKKIRDTGFQPKDGLGFLNYSNASNNLPNELNMFYLGVPDKNPVNLRDADVVTLLGKKNACVDGKLPCTLTLSAQEWKRGANAGMAGGHCWGIATTVAELYNGVRSLASVGGSKNVISTPWNTKLTRQIARAWATQDAINVQEYAYSPATAIKMLKRHLKPGTVPYSMGIHSTSGDGHGVTPVALYKTGDHLYKIAIYDNNYPGRLRAMIVDTKANAYEYEMFTIPGQAPVMAAGKIELVPISVLDGKLPCPFCGGSIAAQVQVAPLPVEDDVKVSVADWDGNAIKGLVHHHPTSPGGLVGMREFGKFEVPAGKNFALTIDASKLTEPVETDARVIDSGVTYTLTNLVLTPGAVVTWYVSPSQGFATVKSTKDTAFNVTAIDTTGGQEWAFTYGELFVGKGGEVTVTMDDEKFISTLSFKDTPTQRIQVLAKAGTSAGTQAVLSEIYAQASGGVTLAQFKGWNDIKDGKLKLSVAQTASGTYTPVPYEPLLSEVDESTLGVITNPKQEG